MKLLLFLLISLLSAPLLKAQNQSAVKFEELRFSFGEIAESGGVVYHVFRFVNTGIDTLCVESAKGQCHCTNAEIITPCILPGETGMIRVEYDPKGRPWAFDAGLDLKFKGTEKTTLYLSGTASDQKNIPRFSPSEFTQRFDFNEKTIESGEREFTKFAESLLPLLERYGNIRVSIESSASQVPTKSYPGNEELTKARSESARKKIRQIIRDAGAREERLEFLPDVNKVQGPEYRQDYLKNPQQYLPYQYVKIRIF